MNNCEANEKAFTPAMPYAFVWLCTVGDRHRKSD